MVSIAVKIGQKGQFVIPKVLRDEFGMSPGDEVVVEEEEGGLFVRKPVNWVAVFEDAARHSTFKGKIDSNKLYDEMMMERAEKASYAKLFKKR